jgi:hypothetical protein
VTSPEPWLGAEESNVKTPLRQMLDQRLGETLHAFLPVGRVVADQQHA